ncbi:MAG: hypothetical protein JWP96_2200 [Polaromonas sp.]|nr:hypothetical protein [Polaromonas sp.]
MDHDTAAYWQGLSNRTLSLARCDDCKHWIHPPKACCPACWSDHVGQGTPSGQATLFSYLVQPLAPGGPPGIVAWAELVEQPRLLVVGELLGETPESVRIGARLTLDWVASRNIHLPVFRQEAAP